MKVCALQPIFDFFGKLTRPNFLATIVVSGEFLVLVVIFPVIFLVGVIFLGDEEVVFKTDEVVFLLGVDCSGLTLLAFFSLIMFLVF